MSSDNYLTVREARAFVHAGLPRFDADVAKKYQNKRPNAEILQSDFMNYLEELLNR